MGVKIPDDKAGEFETVRDAYEFIKSEKAKSVK
jgi:acyl carrier protein